VTAGLGPIRNHRRSVLSAFRGGRIVRRAGHALAIVATLAAGAAITDRTPDADTQQHPFIRSATVGHAVDARTFDVTVLGVRGGAVLGGISGSHDTSGVWVLVRMKLDARTNPVSLGYAVLEDSDGRTYRATGRVDQSILGERSLEPGVPVIAEIAFEVPTALAQDMSLRLAVSPTDQRMDAVAQVRLPITAGQARQWHADKNPLTLAAISVPT